MADEVIRWGILGPGRIADTFATQLPHSRTGRLTAVASRSAERAAAFAERFGAARHYADYDALLADDEVDAVYIATPHPQHLRWTVRAAEAGKHVLCEKPLGINAAEVMAALEAARRHDVFLMEAYMYRCHPQTRRLAELVGSGAVGTVHQIQASFAFASAPDPRGRLLDPELGGGGILDVGGYPLSMARLLAGAARGTAYAEPESLTAVGTVGATGVDEWAAATLQFPGGIVAQISTGVGLGTASTVRVVGSEGYIDVPDPWIPAADAAGRLLVHRVREPVQEIVTSAAAQYAREADSVAAHLDARQSPMMSWDDSLGNALASDQWRRAVGAVLPAERPDAFIPTANGRDLRRHDEHSMLYGRLPGIGKPVSRLIMGVDNQTEPPHATVMFDDFYQRGGNCFDTAYIYGGGRQERLLGRWIADRGVRDEVVVIGKGAHTPHCDPESLVRQLHESLERLQTDHVDLYLMHRDNTDVPVGEFVDALNHCHDEGLLRAFGMSNWSPTRFDGANAYAALNGRVGPVALSNHFSLAEAYDLPWAGCEHVTDAASRRWLERCDVTLLPWSSQARGFFTGRAAPDDRSDEVLARCYYSESNFSRLARATELAERRSVPVTAVALAYVLHQPFPTFPLIGPRTPAETRTSLRALQLDLSARQLAWLEGA